MTTKKRSRNKPTYGSELTSVPPIEPLKPLSFPTFAQLVEEDAQSQSQGPKSKKIQGLFDGMLGDLGRLLLDFQESPEKYGAEVQPLLEQLMSGSTSVERLSTSERRLLDLATYDFFQPKPQKKETPRVAPKTTEEQTYRREKAETPRPRPGIDVPVTELPAYWWLS